MTTRTLNASVHIDTDSGAVLDVRTFDQPHEALEHASAENHAAFMAGLAPDHRAVLIVVTNDQFDVVIGLDFDSADTDLNVTIPAYERTL